jgi:RNA polymerase sigma-70 factor (ECF subfamily)
MNPPELSQLVAQAQRGDRGAFEALVTRLGPRLDRVIAAAVGPALRARIDVDDVRQETLLRALRSLDTFQDQGPESFLRWLASIAHHVVHELAREVGRAEAPIGRVDPAGNEPSPSKILRRQERFDRLEASLASLSPEHREVILLARVERLPLKEVARRMNRSTEAATQLLWRALKKLKENFGSTGSLHLPPRSLLDGAAREERDD